MAYASMRKLYKVLQVIDKADEGVSNAQLKIKSPFLNIGEATERLFALGYITNKVTAYKVAAHGDASRIRHDSDNLWHMTDLGEAALAQYLEKKSNAIRNTAIAVGVFVAVLVAIVLLSKTVPGT